MKQNNTRLYLIIFVLLISVTACGGKVAEPPSQTDEEMTSGDSEMEVEESGVEPSSTSSPIQTKQTTAVDIGEAFHLRVISEGKGSELKDLPDPSIDPHAPSPLSDFTIQKNEIQIHSKLHLVDLKSLNPSRHKQLFFVWPEEILGSKISTATYSNQVTLVQGKILGSLKPKQAWHDIENHRWFIPLSELFKNFKDYTAMDVDLADVQQLDLDLTLEKGQNVNIRIKFQVAGPFPDIQVSPIAAPQPATVYPFAKTILTEGWIVTKEKIVNPTSRPFVLWLKANSSKKNFTMESQLKYPHYQSNAGSPPSGPIDMIVSSMGNLKVGSVEILSGDGTKDHLDLKEGKWFSINLKPKETLILNWKGYPLEHSAKCTIPAPSVATFNWTYQPPQTFHWDIHPDIVSEEEWANLKIPFYDKNPVVRKKIWDPVPPLQHFTQQHQIIWSLQGAVITGDWSKEVRIAPPYITEEEATLNSAIPASNGKSIHYLPLPEQNHEVNLGAGTLQGKAPPHNCQGFFY